MEYTTMTLEQAQMQALAMITAGNLAGARDLLNLVMQVDDRKADDNGWHISRAMTGKMEGITSVSTACTYNPFCMKTHQIPGSVCSKCYAWTLQTCRKNVAAAGVRNLDKYALDLLPMSDIPVLDPAKDADTRIESFGEIATIQQARNYMRLVINNPGIQFAWFTKRPGLVIKAIQLEGKRPANVQLIRSSLMLNKRDSLPKYFDHVFTVWTDEATAAANGVSINCGARHCKTCLQCYRPTRETWIDEILK